MTNRPKNIGTRGELRVRRWLQADGWHGCRRQPLAGGKDLGDLVIHDQPLIIAEVKAGAQTLNPTTGQIHEWMGETLREADHTQADLAVLIVARHRRTPDQFDAWMTAHHWALLLEGNPNTTDTLYGQFPLPAWSRLAAEWATR